LSLANKKKHYVFSVEGRGPKKEALKYNRDFEDNESKSYNDLAQKIMSVVKKEGDYILREINVDNGDSIELYVSKNKKAYSINIVRNKEKSKELKIKKESELVRVLEENFSKNRLEAEANKL